MSGQMVWGLRFGRGIGWFLAVCIGILLLAVCWKLCLPFAAALLLACAVQRPYCRLLSCVSRWRGRKCRSSKSRNGVLAGWRFAAAIFLVLCCVFGGGALLLLFGYLLLSEIGHLFSWFGENGAVISEWVGKLLDRLTVILDRLPLPGAEQNIDLRTSVAESVLSALPGMIGGVVGTVSSKASAAVTAVISALPKILLFFAVFLIAAIYMTVSYDTILVFYRKHLPKNAVAWFGYAKSLLGGTVRSMICAYALLSVLAFVLLFLGLLLLGVDRPFGFALFGMLVDILPVFGVGTLLIPWAILSFFGGNPGRGVGLVVLYLVICFVRQALEPRLIGKTAGVHPLAVLFALYAGGMLFGFAGMIVSPFLLTVIWRGYRMIGGEQRA